jgi:hypothetical protein
MIAARERRARLIRSIGSVGTIGAVPGCLQVGRLIGSAPEGLPRLPCTRISANSVSRRGSASLSARISARIFSLGVVTVSSCSSPARERISTPLRG